LRRYRLQPLRAKPHLLDQADRPGTPLDQPAPRFAPDLAPLAPIDGRGEVPLVEHQKVLERVQVGRELPQEPPLLPDVDHRDLDGPIQAELPVANALQQPDRGVEHVVGGQDAVAEAASRPLDPLGRGDLLLARQERDFAHLHQVDPHGILDLVVFARGMDVVLIRTRFDVAPRPSRRIGRSGAGAFGRLAVAARRARGGPVTGLRGALPVARRRHGGFGQGAVLNGAGNSGARRCGERFVAGHWEASSMPRTR